MDKPFKPFFYDGALYTLKLKDPRAATSKDPSEVGSTHATLRLSVFTHYCGGTPHCQCPGCRTVFLGFLQMDHIKGDGAQHLSKNGKTRLLGSTLYYWLRKNNYPEGFQVLCANCNSAKRQSAACPCAGTDH